MNLNEAIIIIENHNKWRRGNDTVKPTDPKEYGIAIDILLKTVKEKPVNNKKPKNGNS